ncbi:Uncharacterised protein [Bordetella pertussis]|nr:Uncharacterised protein [Bordetella pertussis]
MARDELIIMPAPALLAPACTVALMSPPWAPMPGTSSGTASPMRWRTAASSLGKVAPTTRPHWPLAFHLSATRPATCRYSGWPSAIFRNCRSEPPGLDVRHSTMTPRSPQARYGSTESRPM